MEADDEGVPCPNVQAHGAGAGHDLGAGGAKEHLGAQIVGQVEGGRRGEVDPAALGPQAVDHKEEAAPVRAETDDRFQLQALLGHNLAGHRLCKQAQGEATAG